jgi:hypothetical protein
LCKTGPGLDLEADLRAGLEIDPETDINPQWEKYRGKCKYGHGPDLRDDPRSVLEADLWVSLGPDQGSDLGHNESPTTRPVQWLALLKVPPKNVVRWITRRPGKKFSHKIKISEKLVKKLTKKSMIKNPVARTK